MQNISHSFPSIVHQPWYFWVHGSTVVSKSKSVAWDVGSRRALDGRLSCRNRNIRVVSPQASHTSTLGPAFLHLKATESERRVKGPLFGGKLQVSDGQPMFLRCLTPGQFYMLISLLPPFIRIPLFSPTKKLISCAYFGICLVAVFSLL